jgi:hypothetical protein
LSSASGATANLALRRRPRTQSRPQYHDPRHRLTVPPAYCAASLLALPRCRAGLYKTTCYIVDHAKIAQPTAAAATNSLPRSSVRRRLYQPTHLRPKPPPSQIPIDGRRPPSGPRVPSWEAFGRRPSHGRIGLSAPASETLHHCGHIAAMPLARFKCSEGRDRHPHIRPIGFGCAPCLCLQYFDERHLSGEHLVKIEAVGADQIGLPAAGRPPNRLR